MLRKLSLVSRWPRHSYCRSQARPRRRSRTALSHRTIRQTDRADRKGAVRLWQPEYWWDNAGWKGPGWYWCGYAYRTGLGWATTVGTAGEAATPMRGYAYRGGYGYRGVTAIMAAMPTVAAAPTTTAATAVFQRLPRRGPFRAEFNRPVSGLGRQRDRIRGDPS